MVMKSGTACSKPSSSFWMPEAARVRIDKCLSVREVSQQGPSGRDFFSNKKKKKTKLSTNSWDAL